MRLDKFLSHMGYGTRNEVKTLIKNGWVTIDGKTIKKADTKVDLSTIVYVDDTPVQYVEYEYYILNKPQGYVSATEDMYYPVVTELIDSARHDLYPIGRLDVDTEGLLLISNDGKLAHDLLSPKKHVQKKYYVEFDRVLSSDQIALFSKPMDLGDFMTQPALYEAIDDNHAYLTICEGKFHQVKRMFEFAGATVTYLKRVEFGPLKLGDLGIGGYRVLNEDEICTLKS